MSPRREAAAARRFARSAIVAIALVSCSVTALAFEAPIAEARATLDDLERRIRSDDVMVGELDRLRRDGPRLARRYAGAFRGNAQADFVRDLARALHRHEVSLAATSVAADAGSDGHDGYRSAFSGERVTLDLRGSYRGIVSAVEELSTGVDLVRVESTSIHRAGRELAALVPVVVFEPGRPALATGDDPAVTR